jgi:hypothetical protein
VQGEAKMQMKPLFARLGKVLPWGLTILLAIVCGILIDGTIDQAVTLDHRNQECLLIQKQRDVLQSVAGATAKGITKTQFLKIIKQHNLQYFSKGDNEIVADQVGFIFENDRLTQIETCDDLKACQ